MPKNLYFVDSIFTPFDGGNPVVSLLSTDPAAQGVRTVIPIDDNLMMDDHVGRIQEGWFVFCDHQNRFSYGNNTAYARAQYRKYRRLLNLTIGNYLGEESNDDVVFLRGLPFDNSVTVFSYHINVHHGNCSLILLQKNGRAEIWMVDCSLSEKGNGVRFAANLEAGLNAIRKRLGKKEGEPLQIKRFFLTHLHIDHYSGIEYLVNHGYINNHTLCYWNIYYHTAGQDYLDAWQALINAKVRFIEPVSNNGQPAFLFLHPEKRIYRSRGTVQKGYKPYRIVGKVNNSSTVIRFEIAGRRMVFPGDLEQTGFKIMSSYQPCRGNLSGIDYYAVSHHGSINGHPTVACRSKGAPYPTPLCCVSLGLTRSILMGRDNAYPGIYSDVVKNYWSGLRGSLVYTENSPHFVELEWRTGTVRMY